jgi:16S rRNA (cytosine1402-N4)-methyltransferase
MKEVHKPVLLQKVVELLAPKANQNFVDVTCGFGGHAERILELTGPKGMVIGIDQDQEALKASVERLRPFGGRFKPFLGSFTAIAEAVGRMPVNGGIIADLGVSSYQLETAERGFSFMRVGPLDMRMNQGAKLKAETIVNEWPRGRIAKILKSYADERFASRIATSIERERKKKTLKTTGELAEVVKEAIPRKFWPKNIHPATKTFQAIRMAVNDELNQLRQFLPEAIVLLESRARLAVITFHSREDALVKNFLRNQAKPCQCPPDFPECICGKKPQIKILTKKSVSATDQEIAESPRSRSARLTVAEKI